MSQHRNGSNSGWTLYKLVLGRWHLVFTTFSYKQGRRQGIYIVQTLRTNVICFAFASSNQQPYVMKTANKLGFFTADKYVKLPQVYHCHFVNYDVIVGLTMYAMVYILTLLLLLDGRSFTFSFLQPGILPGSSIPCYSAYCYRKATRERISSNDMVLGGGVLEFL